MARRSRKYVEEGVELIVFGNFIRGYLPGNDFGKDGHECMIWMMK
jgi:hypothetical protein